MAAVATQTVRRLTDDFTVDEQADGILQVDCSRRAVVARVHARRMAGRFYVIQKIDGSPNAVRIVATDGRIAGGREYGLTGALDSVQVGAHDDEIVLLPRGAAAAETPGGSSQTIAVVPGELTRALVGDTVTLGLEATGVTPGTYGDATHIPVPVVDAAGRITDIAVVALSGSAAQTHTHVYAEALTGSGTMWAVGATPIVGSERIRVAGLPQTRVGASPGINEYTISGANVVFGWTPGVPPVADYDTAAGSTHTHRYAQALAFVSGATWNLPEAPVVGSEQVRVAGLPQTRVGASPGLNEYTIAGASVTFGWAVPTSGAPVVADYLV